MLDSLVLVRIICWQSKYKIVQAKQNCIVREQT